MPKAIRSDKKFEVKVWVPEQDKLIFRQHCFQYHLSMMYVAERYLTIALNDFTDTKLREIIEKYLPTYNRLNSRRDNYSPLGLKLTNAYWQKLAYFAVSYHSTVAKIASCIFDYGLSAYEMREVFKESGLEFKKKKPTTSLYQDRLSDWG